jgi:hypothetical protein
VESRSSQDRLQKSRPKILILSLLLVVAHAAQNTEQAYRILTVKVRVVNLLTKSKFKAAYKANWPTVTLVRGEGYVHQLGSLPSWCRSDRDVISSTGTCGNPKPALLFNVDRARDQDLRNGTGVSPKFDFNNLLKFQQLVVEISVEISTVVESC